MKKLNGTIIFAKNPHKVPTADFHVTGVDPDPQACISEQLPARADGKSTYRRNLKRDQANLDRLAGRFNELKHS